MKHLKIKSAVLAVLSAVAVANANAAGTTVDLTQITGAFTSGDIVTGILAVSATLAVVYVTMKAAKIVLGMLRGA